MIFPDPLELLWSWVPSPADSTQRHQWMGGGRLAVWSSAAAPYLVSTPECSIFTDVKYVPYRAPSPRPASAPLPAHVACMRVGPLQGSPVLALWALVLRLPLIVGAPSGSHAAAEALIIRNSAISIT